MTSFLKKAGKGKGFVLFPLLFFLCGCLLIGVVLYPTVQPYVSLLSFLAKDDTVQPSYDDTVSQPTASTAPDAPSQPAQEDTLPDSGTIPLSTFIYPEGGSLFGTIRIPSAEIDCPLYYGDQKPQLKLGAGMNTTHAYIPGYDRTTLIAGHNHTFFSTLGQVKEGDSVFIDTTYGRYEYRITGTRIADWDDESAYDLTVQEENIILYTCYPFKILGYYQQRLFVYGTYVSGPLFDKEA